MADASKKNDLTAQATARDCNVSDLHGFEKEITRMRDLPEYVQEVEYQMEHRLGEHHDVVIVYRRTEQESEEHGGYAIDIALKEFQDIMHPITVFTPKLKDLEKSDEFDIDDDDLLLDLDVDEWLAELEKR